MKKISLYNPLKVYYTTEHIQLLSEVLRFVDKKICFYGDETGYFFSPFRRLYEPDLCLTNERFAILVDMLKTDVNLARRMFKEFASGFDINLIPYYEEQVHTSRNPVNIAYYTLVLSVFSRNIDDKLSNYVFDNASLLSHAIDDMHKYSISNNELHWQQLPKDRFVVSYEKDFDGEGILITKNKLDTQLIQSIDKLNYYYQGGKT